LCSEAGRFTPAYTPQNLEPGLFNIRDECDYPVLYTAILEGIDIIITGDKDFDGIDIEKPEIMSVIEFTEKYMGS